VGPMYSLEQVVAPPPFSALMSIALISGVDWLGFMVLRAAGLLKPDQQIALRWQSVIVGSMVLALVLYPAVLLNLGSHSVMSIIAVSLMGVGVLHLGGAVMRTAATARAALNWVRQVPLNRGLIVAILVGLLLLALAPVTSADALDYHIGAALAMLRNGGMPNSPEWFHSRLAGNGEVLNALGLAVGAEQFGALLQFASLVGIAALIASVAKTDQSAERARWGSLVVLVAVSTPVLLFLVSGPKPQLWPIAMTTLAFGLLTHPSIDLVDKKALRIRFAFVCVLCMSAAQAKFNFLLGGGIVGLLGLVTMIRRRELLPALLIGAVAGTAVMALPLFWKAQTYDAPLLEVLLSPLPGHLPGTDSMAEYASQNVDFGNALPFPVALFVPSEIGGVTVVLGLSWLVLLWLRPQRNLRSITDLIAVLGAVLATAVLAPPAARMYMEPLFWGLFLCALQVGDGTARFPRPIAWLATTQAMGFLLACLFGALTLFPGALLPQWRESIMQRAANGYGVMRWVDQVLPAGAVFLNGHRSMALAPRKAIDYSWTNYVDAANPDARTYLDRIRSEGVTYILLPGDYRSDLPLAGCFGRLFAGPGPGRTTARNPFNQGSPYDAWLVEFDAQRLPECAHQLGPVALEQGSSR